MDNKWKAPELPGEIPHGDMPGDKICIGEEHIRKAKALFPELMRMMEERRGGCSRRSRTNRSTCSSPPCAKIST